MCRRSQFVVMVALSAFVFTSPPRAEPQQSARPSAELAEATVGAQRTADALLRNLARGNTAAAYALYVQEITEQMSIETFARVWVPLQALGIWTARWTSSEVARATSASDEPTIELRGVLRTIAGPEVGLEATVIRVDGAYRMVCLKFKEK